MMHPYAQQSPACAKAIPMQSRYTHPHSRELAFHTRSQIMPPQSLALSDTPDNHSFLAQCSLASHSLLSCSYSVVSIQFVVDLLFTNWFELTTADDVCQEEFIQGKVLAYFSPSRDSTLWIK